MLVNLLPSVAAAAVRRRRVQEARHRPRGVLAQRRSARRGGSPTRTARGSPTARRRRRPDVLEGTPANPGPRRGRRHAVLVHADRRGACRGRAIRCRARTWRPARSDRTRTRARRQDYDTGPDVVTSPPNPNGPGFTPGVPAPAIPGQLPPDMGGRAGAAAARSAGCAHRAGRPAAVPRGRTSRRASRRCRRARRTAAAAGTRPCAGPGRHPAAARQPAVPSTSSQRVGAQTMSTIFNVRNLKLPNVSRAAVIIGSLVVVLGLIARRRRLAALQEADQQHRRRVLPRHPCAVPRRQGPDHGRQGRHRSTRSSRPATR